MPAYQCIERAAVEDIGKPEFVRRHHFDVIHGHYQGVDVWLAEACQHGDGAYVVTLHGSHEAAGIAPEIRDVLAKSVDHWVYTADKNLAIFDGAAIDARRLTNPSNAVRNPCRLVRPGGPRAKKAAIYVGIACVPVLRAKGWDIASDALAEVRRVARTPVHLALCGDGDDYEELSHLYGAREGVHFLGYQEAVGEFYRLCDCCLLPTRFAGESFPFTLIESLKAGTPIIASDVAELPRIVTPAAPADRGE